MLGLLTQLHECGNQFLSLLNRKIKVLSSCFGTGNAVDSAESAAETAEFSAAQRMFWEMHDLLFENQEQPRDALYSVLAEELGLSQTALLRALEEGTYEDRVRADFSSGVRSGVNRTPTFFINGTRHDGTSDYETLVLAYEKEW